MATKKPTPKAKKASTTKRRSSNKTAEARKAAPGKRGDKKDKCFVISPFGGWHDDYYNEIYCPSIKAAGLEPARADDLFRSSNIVHDIWHLVVSSRVLLADLSGKNPNVFYELGLAHAARKPVLLVTQSMEDVPFDLRALRVITYDIEHPMWGQVLRDSIKQGLKEMLESPERSVLPTFLLEEPEDQPKVSPEDARLIELQQQVDSLRTELRASGASRPSRISSFDARDLIQRDIARGLPKSLVLKHVVDRGAPRYWAQKEVARQFEQRIPD